MPRRQRHATGGFVFHVLNRAIQSVVLFEHAHDYQTFLQILKQAEDRPFRVHLYAWVLMPNHWHLLVSPTTDDALSRFMQWVTGTHARRWREARSNRGRGALYQGRYKALAVQQDGHFLSVCRYVERNALRAQLVHRVEDWPWTSASPSTDGECRPTLASWPVPKPADWLELLNSPDNTSTTDEIRSAIWQDLPYGNAAWRAGTMARLRGRQRAPQLALPSAAPPPDGWPE